MTSTTIIESFELKLKTCVREVAGKRKVFSASWQEKDVFVKIFTHKDSAQRHWKRDVNGIKLFQEKGILTPKLLWSGNFPALEKVSSENSYGIIVEAVEDAESMAELWENTPDKSSLLKKAVKVIASHHKAGLVQSDLHFGNFLFSGEECYSLDGDALQNYEETPLLKAAENYALLTAQAEVSNEKLFIDLIDYYCELTKFNAQEFKAAVEKNLLTTRKKRCHRLIKKIYRQCTAVNTYNAPGRRSFIQSKFDSAELRELIDKPESYFPKNSSQLLKDGNSATVALVELEGKKLVVKRYNYNKNLKTFIRRFRKSRASISWSNAFRLMNYGMKTPEPYALVETFKGPMIDHAYFIAEHVEGKDLKDFFEECEDPSKIQETAQKVNEIFSVWNKCLIAHGDCKATNFILNEDQVYIIDLDAMQEMNKRENFEKAHKKDLKRWMKNWDKNETLKEYFKTGFQS